MAASRRVVEVIGDWAGLGGPARIGQLHATPSRGKEILSFEYDRAWLESPHALVLDPSLRLHHGPQHAAQGRDNFGVFLDSSPDRWGRVLLQRREAQLARVERRSERSLLESDYLLGVFDGHRLGALRFRIAGGPFLDDDAELASPPWTSLRELEQASLHLERDGLVEVLTQQGAHAPRDLEQLWRRIVFFLCISNVDDHLRNHGFLLEKKGWSLAPAYDMNPVAEGDGLTLNISETDNAQDLALTLDVAEHFRVKSARAKQIAEEVKAAVREWRAEAKRAGIPRAEQDRMANAFRLADS